MRVILIKKTSRSLQRRRRKEKAGRKKTVTGSKRFVSSTSSVEMDKICKGFVPKNTEKATNWAVRVFEQWRVERNRATSDDGEMCPSNLLQYPVQVSLNYWLLRFVVDARREDGQPYPPTSVSNFLAGLYRECRKYDPNCPNYMNRKDPTISGTERGSIGYPCAREEVVC